MCWCVLEAVFCDSGHCTLCFVPGRGRSDRHLLFDILISCWGRLFHAAIRHLTSRPSNTHSAFVTYFQPVAAFYLAISAVGYFVTTSVFCNSAHSGRRDCAACNSYCLYFPLSSSTSHPISSLVCSTMPVYSGLCTLPLTFPELSKPYMCVYSHLCPYQLLRGRLEK